MSDALLEIYLRVVVLILRQHQLLKLIIKDENDMLSWQIQ